LSQYFTQARRHVLGFEEAKHIFRRQDFCFYNAFKTKILGTMKSGGYKSFGGTARECPVVAKSVAVLKLMR